MFDLICVCLQGVPGGFSQGIPIFGHLVIWIISIERNIIEREVKQQQQKKKMCLVLCAKAQSALLHFFFFFVFMAWILQVEI